MRTGATFRVHGLKADEISTALGMESSTPDGVWRVSVKAQDGVELSEPLTVLLDLLAPVHSELSALRSRGAEFDFFCFVGSNGAEHAAILTPDLLSRISEIGAELWLDIYPNDFDTK